MPTAKHPKHTLRKLGTTLSSLLPGDLADSGSVPTEASKPFPSVGEKSSTPIPIFLLLALSCVLVCPERATAQAFLPDFLSFEPRVGAAFPTGDFGNVDPSFPPGGESCPFPLQIGTEVGWRWSLRALAEIREGWSVVGEYGRAHLGCSATFCGSTKKPETQSVGLGLRVVAFPLGSMNVWVEGGGVLEETTIIRTRDESGDSEVSAVPYPWSLGFSGGFGTELALTGSRTSFFTPGFRFRYVPADPPDTDPDLAPITTTYMLFEIGFRFLLGR